MKQFRNASDITVDSCPIVKGGYIQLPVPIVISEEWMQAPSIADGYDSNGTSVLYPLRSFQITENDLRPFFGRTIYALPEDGVYYSHLELIRQDVMMDYGYMTDAEFQDFLTESDEYIERITNQYSAISDLLITRIWNYRLFERNKTTGRYLDAYKTLCTISVLQLLLIISVNTPKFNLSICFEET